MAVAALILLASVWFAFAGPGAKTEPAPKGAARQPGSGSPAGRDERVRADDLLQRMQSGSVPPEAPEGLVLHRPKPDRLPDVGSAGLASLTGRVDAFAVLLEWETGPGAAAGGFVVEQLSEDGDAGPPVKLGAGARSHTCATVDTLAGSRLYRVSVLAQDGTVVEGSARERLVAWEIDTRMEFLGHGPDGAARFRVQLLGSGLGESATRVFSPGPEGAIGGRIDAAGGMPALDWNTGFVFRGLRGRRREEPATVKVPRFGPDGSIAGADTGETEYVDRELKVSEVVIEAMILRPEAPRDVRWLPETKD